MTHHKVELEGIEPSSVGWLPAALRPFPCSWLMAATLPGELGPIGPATGSFSGVRGLSRLSAVFPGCPLPLLVPGCGSQAPRAIAGRDDSLPTDKSGGENEIVRIGVSVGAPFLESEQLRSHVGTSWSQRRNRSAPLCMLSIVKMRSPRGPPEGVSQA